MRRKRRQGGRPACSTRVPRRRARAGPRRLAVLKYDMDVQCPWGPSGCAGTAGKSSTTRAMSFAHTGAPRSHQASGSGVGV